MMTLCLAFCLGAATAPPPAMQTLRADDIAQAVIETARERWRSPDRRIDVALLGRLQDQMLPKGDVRVEVGEIAGPWPRQKVGVPVTVLVDGRKTRAMTVWLAVRMPQRAWVYGNAYAAGLTMDTLQIVQSEVDLACCSGSPVTSPAELAEFRLRKSVRSGQPLMQADFERLPDVQARTAVQIEVVHGSIRLATSGRALGDGRIGEFIDVLPDGSRAVVRTRVTAKQKVGIHE